VIGCDTFNVSSWHSYVEFNVRSKMIPMHACITFRIDYCISLFVGIPKTLGHFNFWLSLSLSESLSETLSWTLKSRLKTKVQLNFGLTQTFTERKSKSNWLKLSFPCKFNRRKSVSSALLLSKYVLRLKFGSKTFTQRNHFTFWLMSVFRPNFSSAKGLAKG